MPTSQAPAFPQTRFPAPQQRQGRVPQRRAGSPAAPLRCRGWAGLARPPGPSRSATSPPLAIEDRGRSARVAQAPAGSHLGEGGWGQARTCGGGGPRGRREAGEVGREPFKMAARGAWLGRSIPAGGPTCVQPRIPPSVRVPSAAAPQRMRGVLVFWWWPCCPRASLAHTK